MFSGSAGWDGDGGGKSCDYGADESVPAARGGMETSGGFYDYGADENKLASRVGEKTVCNNDRCQFCDYGADENELDSRARAMTAWEGDGRRILRLWCG